MREPTNHLWEDLPKCPFCDHVEDQPSDIFADGDDTATIECSACGKEYECEAQCSWTYTSTPKAAPLSGEAG